MGQMNFSIISNSSLFFALVCCIVFHKCNSQSTDTLNDYYGYELKDNYQHLENLNDSTVISWLRLQNDKTKKVLSSIPGKQNLLEHLKRHDESRDYVIYQNFILEGDLFIYLKRNSNENISKLYMRKGLEGKEILLFSLEKYKEIKKSSAQINYMRPNWDGTKIAISLNQDGSEISEILILDTETKKILPDTIKNCSPSILNGVQWLPNNISFLYSNLPNSKSNGSDALLDSELVVYNSEDNDSKVLFSKKNNPNLNIKSEEFPIVELLDPNYKYATGIIASSSPYYDSFYKPINKLEDQDFKWTPLFTKKRKIKSYRLNNDDIFYLTAEDSENFKICRTSILNSNFDSPEIIVEEKEDEIIKYFEINDLGIFYSTVINGVTAKLYFKDQNGNENEILLPKPSGDVKIFKNEGNVIVSIKGWLSETERFIYNPISKDLQPYEIFPGNNNAYDDLLVEEVTIKSHDGVKVPLSLIYKKGIKLDGSNPVLMRAYGAYGASMVPNAYYPFLLYAQQGGIYALAHVRGGGEKGDNWYKGGYKATKPNSWKDLIACANFLIDKGYSKNEKIALWGGSAGAVAIGRALTEQPGLFGAAIIDRGILNTVRLEEGINGANSSKEFGSVKDSTEFRGLLEMDSFHSLSEKQDYPTMLIRTGINDSRVAPWQSIKFAAKLMEISKNKNSVLLKTEFNSGHGLYYNNKEEEFKMIVETLSFALWQTGHPDYQPKN